MNGNDLYAEPPSAALTNIYTESANVQNTPLQTSPPAPAPTGYEWRGGRWLAGVDGFVTAPEVSSQTLYTMAEWQWWLLPTVYPATLPPGPHNGAYDNVYEVWRALGEDVQVNSTLVAQHGINHWPPVQADRGAGGLQLIPDPGPTEVPPVTTGAISTNAGSGSQTQPSEPKPTISGGNNPINASIAAAPAITQENNAAVGAPVPSWVKLAIAAGAVWAAIKFKVFG